MIHTHTENCRRHGTEPYACRKDLLTRLPTATNRQAAQLQSLDWQKNRRPIHGQAA